MGRPEPGRELLYLSQADVESAGLSMAEIIAALEAAFREKAKGCVEMPAKIGIHTQPDAFLHAMPASLQTQKPLGSSGSRAIRRIASVDCRM